ncbi:WYL domain-containing protein [Acinetobacter modestus]|uniref:helix-turn-helix transcriptional regulator n=1 Tax=Acinetobacter modestus TaxID=1776740 RepID=UPI00203024AB|nr:WYL domain-containing protein [Acinetobacter modestus]MCM1960587.1 WYL domain-containing protein [Acinetobacter modestus]
MKTTKAKGFIKNHHKYRLDADINQVNRILNLYHHLPRSPQVACPMDQLKTEIQSWYNNEIDEQSIRKAIKRDLDKLKKILVTGTVHCISKKGNQPNEYYLSEDAAIEKMNAELALVLVMASNYLHQYLPEQVYLNVVGFFESATKQLEQNTLLQDWQERIRFVPTGYHNMDIEYYITDQVKNIYTALLDNEQWIKCLYRKEGEKKQNIYTLKPHGIIQYGNKQYLMASKIIDQKNELRTFNMQRFDRVTLIPQSISIDIDSYDLDCLVEEKEYEDAHFERENLSIKLRCENYLRDELESYPIDEYQHIIDQNEDYFILEAKSIITTSVLNWLVEKSHSIQVIEPQELFEKVKVHVLAARNYYDVDYDDLAEYRVDEKEESDLDSFFDDESNAEIEGIAQNSVELDHE